MPCEAKLCEHSCQGSALIGNLNAHAKWSHLGSCIYLNTRTLKTLFVFCPTSSIIQGKPLYINDKGQDVIEMLQNGSLVKKSQFERNEACVSYLSKIVMQNLIPAETFTSAYESVDVKPKNHS